MNAPPPQPRDLVPHREPGPVRRGRARARSPTSRRAGVRRARRVRGRSRPPSSPSRCSPTPPRSAAVMLEANADDACVGVDRVDAHVQPRQDVDHRPRRAAQAAAAPAHAGQRRAALGRDRHGLHEPQPGRPRRPGVRVRADPARPRPQDRRRPRQRPAGHGSCRGVGAGGARACASCATMRLARFGDNMRNVAVTEGDKVEAELRWGVSVNTYGVNDLVEVGRRGRRQGDRRPRRGVRRPLRRGARAARRRRAARVAALRRPDRARPAGVPDRRRASPRSPRTSRTSAGCGSCPVSPCSA